MNQKQIGEQVILKIPIPTCLPIRDTNISTLF